MPRVFPYHKKSTKGLNPKDDIIDQLPTYFHWKKKRNWRSNTRNTIPKFLKEPVFKTLSNQPTTTVYVQNVPKRNHIPVQHEDCFYVPYPSDTITTTDLVNHQ